MKQRHPGTFEDGVARIVGALGAARAGAVVGKSGRLVYAWGDPDSDLRPSVHQALALDTAYVEAGLGAAPIYRAYRRRVRLLAAPAHAATEPTQRFMDVVRECGELSASLRAAAADARWTPRERLDALAAVAELRAELDKLDADIEAVGAAPRALALGMARAAR